MVAMELASRIVSIMLGVAVAVLLLWPITVPVGFGEAWWASRQAQSPGGFRSDHADLAIASDAAAMSIHTASNTLPSVSSKQRL